MPIFGMWADLMSVYMAPLGAAIAAIVFFWLDKDPMEYVNKGAVIKQGRGFEILAKYIYIFVSLGIVVLGWIYGGIG
jgi:NSS family neurotransmitter:Na+ symporter